MEKNSRRRLRSASVHLGAVTLLALALGGCDTSDDDDDCASGPSDEGRVISSAMRIPDATRAHAGGDTYSTGYSTARVPAGSTDGATDSIHAATDSTHAATDSTHGSALALPERGGFGTHLASCGG